MTRRTTTTLMTTLMTTFLVVSVARAADFKVETAKLRVTSPSSVSGTYDVAIANFGRTLYGASLSGRVAYPEDPTQRLACGNGTRVDVPRANARVGLILLLDRGGCAFTEKVMNAQNAGADAVLIVDDVDEPLVTMDAAEDAETGSYVRDISIPTALVRKVDGALFESAVSNGENVVGTLDWHDVLPHPDSRVEWELWIETNDECGYKCETQNAFLRDFKPIAQSLEKGGYTQFTPHFITWECIDDPPTSAECVSQCVNVGRYCAPDPDEDIHAGYSGADIVIDNLRALCVFDVANKSNTPWLWWDYVSEFGEQCTMKNGKFAARSCAEKVVSNIGVDVAAVNACIGDTTRDDINPMLEAQIEAQSPPPGSSRPNIRLLPTILINEERYNGKLARGEVLTAICAGFEDSSVPEICSNAGLMHAKCVHGQEGATECAADKQQTGKTACAEIANFPYYECACPEGQQSVIVDDQGTTKCQLVKPSEGNSTGGGGAKLVLTSVFTSILSVAFGLYAFFQYRARSLMDKEVRQIMAQYMPLDQEPTDDSPYDQPPRGPTDIPMRAV